MVESEVYLLKHNGQDLVFGTNQDLELRDFISTWDGQGTILSFGGKKFEQQYVLGHEENMLCKVYKNNSGEQGGIVAVFERSELLLVGYSMDNLTYLESIGHYAKLVTYTRYGYDIYVDE